MTPRAVANPERTMVFWNARFDGFEILRDVGISSPYWRAAWEAAEPGAEPTLVWTHDEQAVQIDRGEFLELCTEAERLSKGLFDQPQAWGYWAEVVEAWLADPAFAKPGPARDLRRARISLLQMAADCSSGSAACGDDVPRLLTLAETVTSMEAAPLPSIEEVRAKLNSPLYSLSQQPGWSQAFRTYFKWLYDAVEESTVYDRLGG